MHIVKQKREIRWINPFRSAFEVFCAALKSISILDFSLEYN